MKWSNYNIYHTPVSVQVYLSDVWHQLYSITVLKGHGINVAELLAFSLMM
jgi:hypothetical protein